MKVNVQVQGDQHVFEIRVCLGALGPRTLRVELYANGIQGDAPIRQGMGRVHPQADISGAYLCAAALPAARSAMANTCPTSRNIAAAFQSIQEAEVN